MKKKRKQKAKIELIERSKKDPTIIIKVTDEQGNSITGLKKEDFKWNSNQNILSSNEI